MARKIEFTPIITTLASLNTQAGLNNLLVGELYYVSDSQLLAQATAINQFKLYDIPTALSELSDDSTHRLVTDSRLKNVGLKARGAAINSIATSVGHKNRLCNRFR